jgi:hypothetical protein
MESAIMIDSISPRPASAETQPAKLTAADFQRYAEFASGTADRNRDGVVTMDELRSMQTSSLVDAKLLPSVEFMIDHYDNLQYLSRPLQDAKSPSGVSPDLIHEFAACLGGAHAHIDRPSDSTALALGAVASSSLGAIGGMGVGVFVGGLPVSVGLGLLAMGVGMSYGVYREMQDHKKVVSVLADIPQAEACSPNWPK